MEKKGAEQEVLERKGVEQGMLEGKGVEQEVLEWTGVENEVVGVKAEQEGARQDWSLLGTFLSSMGTPVLVLVRLYSEI
jgi:hypothetical protein